MAQGADLTTLTRSVTSVNQQLATSAQQTEKAALALQQAGSSQAAAASSGAKSADQLREAATKLDSAATAATAASAAASNNAEGMKQLMVWAGATTQNVSTVSKEVSYLNDVTVKAGGTMAAVPEPVLLPDAKNASACSPPFKAVFEMERSVGGRWLQHFVCKR